MALTKNDFIDTLFTHICDECGDNNPFDEATDEKEKAFTERWLPNANTNIAEANEAFDELIDLLYTGMRAAFAVGYNVANEINRPVVYNND